MKALGLRRERSLSPGVHATSDSALLEAVLHKLSHAGWHTQIVGEEEVAHTHLPEADLYLNMCQGRASNERLLELEHSGSRLVNRPSAALSCHRHALVKTLRAAGVPFVDSLLVHRGDAALVDGASSYWVKRGDVHAQVPEDVVRVAPAQVGAALAQLYERGIEGAVVQPHLEGRLVKFYGLGSFFRAFEPEGVEVEHPLLRELAFAAAGALGLEVFGGDAIIGASSSGASPVLIDVNDFPSMARYREEAAEAIARYVTGGPP